MERNDGQRFEPYLRQLSEQLALEREEREELIEEWRQHLLDAMRDGMERGLTPDEAAGQAMRQFGEIGRLQKEVNESYPSARKMLFLKELIVWAVCLSACLVGPGLLIGAHFRVDFITFPLTVLLFCSAIYHCAVRRIIFPKARGFALFLLYGSFVLFIAGEFSFAYFAENLFSFRLAGSEGIYTIASLHGLWLVVCIFAMAGKRRKPGSELVRSSFEYWFMAMTGLLLSFLAPSAERSVLIMNVFLLYGFLQQIVVPQSAVILKNKAAYGLRR